jgi:hypothetical protein
MPMQFQVPQFIEQEERVWYNGRYEGRKAKRAGARNVSPFVVVVEMG